MVGETVLIGDRAYVQVNTQGTLEQLPRMRWYWVLWLWFITRGGDMPVSWIREFCGRHADRRL